MVTSKVSTTQIVERLQQGMGSEEDFRELYDRYFARILGYFTKRESDREEARDLAQATFMKAFASINTIDDPTKFESWLFAIAASLFKNHVRHRHAQKRQTESELHSQRTVPIEEREVADPDEPDALDRLISAEQLEEALRRINELPPQVRRCVTLRYWHGLKYREIAEVEGIPIGTVKSYLHLVRKKALEQ